MLCPEFSVAHEFVDQGGADAEYAGDLARDRDGGQVVDGGGHQTAPAIWLTASMTNTAISDACSSDNSLC